jgi:hypothetical protein
VGTHIRITSFWGFRRASWGAWTGVFDQSPVTLGA